MIAITYWAEVGMNAFLLLMGFIVGYSVAKRS